MLGIERLSSPKFIVTLLSIFLIGITVLFDLIPLFIVYIAVLALFIYSWHINFDFSLYHLICFLIISSLLIPPLELGASIPELRLEGIIIYLFFPLILIKKWKNPNIAEAKFFEKIYLLFLGCMVFSLFWGKIFLGVPVGTRDFLEIIKISKYLLIFSVITRLDFTAEELHNILYVTVGSIFLSGIIGLFQYYGLLGFEHITAPLYFDDRIYDIHNRMMGTFRNPNTYSFIIVVGYVISFVLLLNEKHKLKQLFFITAILLFIWLVILTQSRTGAGILIISTILITLFFAINKQFSFTQLVLLIGGILFVGAAVTSFVSYQLISRFESAINLATDQSWQMRLFAWYLNFNIFLDAPVFGWGPAKHLYTTIVDNEYILILRQYGIVGFLVYIWLYILPIKSGLRNIYSDYVRGYYAQIIVFVFVCFLATNMTNQLFHVIQAMDFWYVILSLFFVAIKDNLNTQALSTNQTT